MTADEWNLILAPIVGKRIIVKLYPIIGSPFKECTIERILIGFNSAGIITKCCDNTINSDGYFFSEIVSITLDPEDNDNG